MRADLDSVDPLAVLPARHLIGTELKLEMFVYSMQAMLNPDRDPIGLIDDALLGLSVEFLAFFSIQGFTGGMQPVTQFLILGIVVGGFGDHEKI